MYIHEGDYPSEVPGSPGSVRDNFTEAIMLNMAIYPSPNSLFQNALSSHLLAGDPASSGGTARVASLKYALSNLDDPKYVAKADTYSRYWHGYLVPLKSLLLILNPAENRFLNLVFQLVLVGMNCALIAKKQAQNGIGFSRYSCTYESNIDSIKFPILQCFLLHDLGNVGGFGRSQLFSKT